MIVECARSYIGTPFIHQGRIKGVGVDCVGLIFAVAWELGISLKDKQDFRVFRKVPPSDTWLTDYLEEQCTKSNGDPGDVLVLWIDRHTRRPQHLGIATDVGIIHSYSGNKVVEHALNGLWPKMVVAAYKLPGVE